jgi:predicted lipoprotein with Yx(FWY)xxD motif
MDNTQQATHRWHLFGRLVGAGLLAATGAIHLDLYLTGYRSIPTIGWLFLLQVIAAFGLAGLIVLIDSWLLAAAGAGFAASTLGGYLLSVWVGLFGFKEVRTTAGIVAGVIEVAAFAVLALVAADSLGRSGAGSTSQAGQHGGRLRTRARLLEWAVAGATIIAGALLGVAAASATGSGSTATGGHAELKTGHVGNTSVLTNARGFTLYWFAPDGPTTSRCYGTCAAYWPPVLGTPTAGPGVTGTLGTIKRSDGALQATYDHHPLYAYIGDSAPGQARGNGLNLNGGLWHEVTVSGGTG